VDRTRVRATDAKLATLLDDVREALGLPQ
jgi:hypothetical protein